MDLVPLGAGGDNAAGAAGGEDAAIMEYTTQRGEILYELNGKYYSVYSAPSNRPVKFLRCYHCKRGTAKVDVDTGVVMAGTTQCLPGCHADLTKLIARAYVRKYATQPYAQNPAATHIALYAETVAAITNAHGGQALQYLPSENAIRSAQSRERRKHLPAVPHSYADIPIQDFPREFGYLRTVDADEQFLYINQEIVHNGEVVRVMGFTTETDVKYLRNSRTVYVDGTFSTTPKPFKQFFTFHTLRGPDAHRSVLLPRFYLLLPGKSAEVYTQTMELVLQVLENVVQAPGDVQWHAMSMDFESGLIAAMRTEEVNPGGVVALQCCHYHFCAAVYKQATVELHLRAEYANPNGQLKRFLQYLYALPFLPEERMFDALQELLAQHSPPTLVGDPRFAQLVEYYNNTWIQNDVNRRLCNVYERPERRTNNDLEGWHNKLQQMVGVHEELWTFIAQLQKLHYLVRVQDINISYEPSSAIKLRKQLWRVKENVLVLFKRLYDNNGYNTDVEYVMAVAAQMAIL